MPLETGLTARLAPEIAAVSVLDDPVRASVFFLVARAGEPVSRDDVATALRVSRRTAAIHLDRLAEIGLVDVSFKRTSGRTGPGAGRTSKLYRRSARRLSVNVPARNYELLARVLVSAVKRPGKPATAPDLETEARAFGQSIGGETRKGLHARPSQKRLLNALVAELEVRGFEPFSDQDGTIRLRNCPFHEMAQTDQSLVCGVNLAVLQGLVDGLGLRRVVAALEPAAATCCVAFR